MDIQLDFSRLSSKVYEDQIGSSLGEAEGALFRFAESTGEMVLEQFQAMKRGGKPSHYDFFLNLNRSPFSAEKIETLAPDAFHIPRHKEKRAERLLSENKIIKKIKKPTIKKNTLLYTAEAVKTVGLLTIAGITGVFTGPAALLSLGLRWFVDVARHEVIGMAPDSCQKVLKDNKDLSILTLNIGFSESEIVNLSNGLNDSVTRSTSLAQFLLKTKSDIICLQEAFHSRVLADHVIPHFLEKKYSVALTVKPKKIIGLSAGLVIASKYPIKEIGFHEFKNPEGIDKRAKKGVLMAVLEIKKGEYICVANTHMQAKYEGQDAVQKRKKQFAEAKQAIDKFCQKSKYSISDVVFCGDFNTSRYKLQSNGKLNEARENPVYMSLEKGLLRKDKRTHTRYKDLTKPDVKLTFKQFIKRTLHTELKDEAERVRNNESGSRKGTVLEKEAYTFKYFLNIIVQKVWDDLGKEKYSDLRKKLSKKDIENYVNAYVKDKKGFEFIKDRKYIDFTENEIGKIRLLTKKHFCKTRKNIFTKPSCVDHICLAQTKNNILSEKGYTYKLRTPIGKAGVLSDHRAVIVKLKQT